MRPLIRRSLATVAIGAACLGTAAAVGWFAYPPLVVLPMRALAYWTQGISSASIAASGHEWPYLRAGDPASTPVILLHGFGTSKDAMMRLMPPLAQAGYCVYAPDLPGFGDHPYHAGCTHDPSFYVAQLGQFMDAVGAPHAIVVGTSMGGALATELAVAQPERVLALALLSPAGVKAPVHNEFMKSIDRGELPLLVANEQDFDRVARLVFAHPPAVPRPLRAWLVQRYSAHPDQTLEIVQAMRPCLSGGLEDHLGEVRAPTFVLYGQCDAVTDPSMATVFARRMPGARVVMVPDAGHVAFYDNPTAVWAELSGWLASVRGPQARRP